MSEHSSTQKLNNTDYNIWTVLMDAVLDQKHVKDVLDCSSVMPTAGRNSTAGKAWIMENNKAHDTMILSVESDQLAHMTSPFACKIWEKLERIYRARDLATRLSLRHRFLTVRTSANQSISDWIAIIQNLAHQLRTVDINFEDKDLILVFTMGFPANYDSFVISLDATPPDELTLNNVVTRLLNEESS